MNGVRGPRWRGASGESYVARPTEVRRGLLATRNHRRPARFHQNQKQTTPTRLSFALSRTPALVTMPGMFKVKRRLPKRSSASKISSSSRNGSEASSMSTATPNLRSCLRHQLAASETSASHQSGPEGGSFSSSGTRLSKSKRKVRFAQVRVREFERILGDNPSCSSGAPVA